MNTVVFPSVDPLVPCQQEQFNLELLAEKLQKDLDTSEPWMEELGKENSSTSRHHGPGGSRIQNLPVL